MAGFCCCPCGEELEEYVHPGNSIYRHCVCFRFFFHQIFTGYGVMFHRLESRPIPTPIPTSTSIASSGVGPPLPDSSSEDTDPRYSRLQRDGLVSRREKSMTHFQEDSQPVRRNYSSSSTELVSFGKKWNEIDSEDEDSTIGQSEFLEKASGVEVSHGLASRLLSSEDEDVCPTCLDEYTSENPKITTRCSHHFHLGCIYEWLERSESCPICGKEMEFCESP